MTQKQLLVLVHPHFTLPGGAGKYALEVLQHYTSQYRVVAIGQAVEDWWKQQYPTITFISVHGPLTSSVWYWLLWPFWYYKTARELQRLSRIHETLTLLCSVFPAHWIGLLYKYRHNRIRAIWLCQEPSAFLYSRTWQDAIPSSFKRFMAKALAPLLQRIDQWLVRSADVLIVNSYASQKNVKTVYGRNGVVAYGGVKKKDIPLLPIAQRSQRIMTVARLTRFKRIDVLIQSFIKAQLSEYHFDIYGDGEERFPLERMIRVAGVEGHVHIHPNVDDQSLAEAYSQARLFVLGSRHEPFGIVICEAMAYGTPVIADKSGGPAEIVLSEVTGRLIHLEVDTLAQVLHTVLLQPEVLQAWSDAGIQRAAEQFTWQSAANKIQKYL